MVICAVVFAAASTYGFFGAAPTGDPFVSSKKAFWQAYFRRAHDHAYADHRIRPVGPRYQFFRRDLIEQWTAEESPVKDLLLNKGDNTWRITRADGAEADIVVRRLFLSSNTRRLFAIAQDGRVYFHAQERWQEHRTIERGAIAGMRIADTLRGDERGLLGVAFSPDGSQVVAGGNDGTLALWTLDAGQSARTFQAHEGAVTSVAFSRDGTRIASSGLDGIVQIWTPDGKQIIEPFRPHAGRIWSVAFSPDGTLVACGDDNGAVWLWSLEGKQADIPFYGHKGRVSSVAFSPDGSRIVSGGEDGSIQMWSLEGDQIAQFFGDGGTINSVAFSPDGSRIVSGGQDGAIRLWSLSGRQISISARGHDAEIRSVAYSPDGSLIASGGVDGTMRVWTRDGAPVSGLLQRHEKSIGSVAFSPDGSRIASTSADGTAILWQFEFASDTSIKPTALDASSNIIFGEERLRHPQGSRWRQVDSFFPSPVRAVVETERGSKIAVGDAGSIYVGAAASNAQADQSAGAAARPTVLGSLAGIEWSIDESNRTEGETTLNAVHFSGQTGVAVGDGGLVKVTFDGGRTWQSRLIAADHSPNLYDVRVRVDPQHSYAVAVGLPTGPDAPSHAVLYSTKNLRAAVGEGENGIGDWTHLPWQAGAPMLAYAAFFLALVSLLAAIYFFRLWWLTESAKKQPVAAGKSDREIGWDDHDALGLKPLARQVSLFLRNAQTEPPLVLGVAGGWGSGKSSLMNLLCQDLQRRGASAVKFNAWHHQKEEHLLAALFEAVRTRAIPRFWTVRGLWFRVRLVGPRLLKQVVRIAPVLLVAALLLIVLGNWASDAQIAALTEMTKNHLPSLTDDKGNVTGTALLVGSVPALGLFFWFRSLWRALPAEPAKLLKNFTSLTSLSSFRDKLSFRHDFGQAFREVCRALRMPGVPGLVIFIDDLDRCQATSVLTVFEAVNYFVSCGDCIVVMGFDRMQVEHSIGIELADIADGLPDSEIPFAFGAGKEAKRRAYARHYMEKLINLEVTIPPMTPEAAAALAQDVRKPNLRLDEKDLRWLTKLRPSMETAMTAARVAAQLLIAATVGWYSLAIGDDLYKRMTAQADPAITTERTADGGSESGPGEGLLPGGNGESSANSTFTDNDVDLADKGTPVDPVSRSYDGSELLVVWPLLVLLGLVAFWLFLRRAYMISMDVEQDPQTFVKALREANEVIEGVNGTPRAVKRFMNRMRFASARMRQINYQTGLLDWLAERMGWITGNFRKNAESAPAMSDRRVVALGTLEAFLGALPDPEVDGRTPEQLLSDRVTKSKDDHETQEIVKNITNFIVNAKVDKAAMKTYSSTLYSARNTLPDDRADGEDQAATNVRPITGTS